MLCRMAFHLSGKVFALHLDNNTFKAYLCNQGGTVSFLSWLACDVLNLADRHGITLIPANIPTLGIFLHAGCSRVCHCCH